MCISYILVSISIWISVSSLRLQFLGPCSELFGHFVFYFKMQENNNFETIISTWRRLSGEQIEPPVMMRWIVLSTDDKDEILHFIAHCLHVQIVQLRVTAHELK